jgi:16S rRNA (cytosine1402-N4)-methyltransferase
MRMDRREPCTAEDIVNDAPEDELVEIFSSFGEERESRRAARAIVAQRLRERIRTTVQLASLIAGAKRHRRGKIHPATRVFQALRMAVNREIESLSQGLEAAWRRLAPGGRMGVISFHSVEDRVVKGFFGARKREKSAAVLTKKPARATNEECDANPRARSARLRVLRRRDADEGDSSESGAAS